MNKLLFALKHALKTPLFILFLLMILLLPPVFYGIGAQEGSPRAAYGLEDTADPDAGKMAGHLKKAGMIPYTDLEQMRQDVAAGRLDAALLIPAGISSRLEKNDIAGILTLYTNPAALLPDLWQNHSAAALFAVYAPYISSSILKEGGVTQEEMMNAYDSAMEDKKLFTFQITSTDGAALKDNSRAQRFFLGTLSLLLFLSVFYGIGAPLKEASPRTMPRIGRRAALAHLFGPGLLLRSLGMTAAAAGACLLASENKYILPAVLYICLLLLVTCLLLMIPNERHSELAVLFITLYSLALCPLYIDFSLLLPVLGKLRLLLPPYWLWLLSGMG